MKVTVKYQKHTIILHNIIDDKFTKDDILNKTPNEIRIYIFSFLQTLTMIEEISEITIENEDNILILSIVYLAIKSKKRWC